MLSFLPELARMVLTAAALAAVMLTQAQAQQIQAPVSGQGTWETTLQGRDLDGNAATFEAYYDTVLDITWLADSHYAKTSNDITIDITGGGLGWRNAMNWAAQLNINGITGWRLPNMVDTGSSGCDLSTAGGTDCGYNVQTRDAVTGVVYSEMAHLYYETLGNKAYCTPGDALCSAPQSGWGLRNTGPFIISPSRKYWWSGLEYAPDATWSAWSFGIDAAGVQGHDYKGGSRSSDDAFAAWAVRPGDIAAAVPEPSTYALMLAGLAALIMIRKRRA